LLICAALLIAFAVTSYTAVLTKSATADEPLHAVAAYVRTFYGDFRLNPDHPPLWGYWAMLPQSRSSLKLDLDSEDWKALPEKLWLGAKFSTGVLYRTAGNDPDRFINRSRLMMLAPAILLGAFIALWAWRLRGAAAAIIATTLFCFDPNFLAHSPLVKDDVTMATIFFLVAYVTWRAGQELTWSGAVTIALLVAAGLNVKFSAMLLPLVLAIVLIARALLPQTWRVLGRDVQDTARKSLLAVAMLLFTAGISILGIWACHDFRYAATHDPGVRLDLQDIALAGVWEDMVATSPNGRIPTREQAAAQPLPILSRLALAATRRQLLPEAWLAGLLETYHTTRSWPCYLMGEYRRTGWWYYYPLAILFKTPLATLAALGVAIVLLVRRITRLDRWTIICLLVPLLVYGLAVITSRLDQGIRHVMPLYPFAFVLSAVALADLFQRWRRAGGILLSVLGLGLIIESVAAYPNYISFFNVAARSHRRHGSARIAIRDSTFPTSAPPTQATICAITSLCRATAAHC
jgi:hypothetical protein